jgi:hypothetical protein
LDSRVIVKSVAYKIKKNKKKGQLTVYDSYGTPYLLSLDLSKELTALVWLAGPLSGLLVQPVSYTVKEMCDVRMIFFYFFFV